MFGHVEEDERVCTHRKQIRVEAEWICEDCYEWCGPAMEFPFHRCPRCGYDAGPRNGWFGSPECVDCRQEISRERDGWTPGNSVD